MTILNRLILWAVLALPLAASAAVPLVVLNEQFNDLAGAGWTFLNTSDPPGLDWFQGNPGVFAAQAGPADSYAAANYLSAANGSGFIDNWLITPELQLLGPSTLSLFARGAQAPGFHDMLEIRFGSNGDFSTLLGTLGGSAGMPADWQRFAASLDFVGSGQFAFRYIGDAAAANYVGLDTVLVSTVPEPAGWLMLAAGALSLAVLRRRPFPS